MLHVRIIKKDHLRCHFQGDAHASGHKCFGNHSLFTGLLEWIFLLIPGGQFNIDILAKAEAAN